MGLGLGLLPRGLDGSHREASGGPVRGERETTGTKRPFSSSKGNTPIERERKRERNLEFLENGRSQFAGAVGGPLQEERRDIAEAKGRQELARGADLNEIEDLVTDLPGLA